jgi:hypothetical protein
MWQITAVLIYLHRLFMQPGAREAASCFLRLHRYVRTRAHFLCDARRKFEWQLHIFKKCMPPRLQRHRFSNGIGNSQLLPPGVDLLAHGS